MIHFIHTCTPSGKKLVTSRDIFVVLFSYRGEIMLIPFTGTYKYIIEFTVNTTFCSLNRH